MTLVRSFAGLMFLVALTASASPEAGPGSGNVSPVQVARVNRANPAEPLPLAARPVDEARRDAASTSLDEFSGGSVGTLLIAASLLAAVALILAVVVSW